VARALAGGRFSQRAATVTTTGNAYCATLGISPPRIEEAKSSPDADYYSLLIIALLERGGPMTLAEAAARFAAAGVTSSANEALAALKRCKPARAPIHRDGDSYALDPHDDEVDSWLFRLGLPSAGNEARAVVAAFPERPSTVLVGNAATEQAVNSTRKQKPTSKMR
jgi:hypothetical protein